MTYSRECVIQVWNDEHGERIEIGPDHDGLGLLELRLYDADGHLVERISMPAAQAKLAGESLVELATKMLGDE